MVLTSSLSQPHFDTLFAEFKRKYNALDNYANATDKANFDAYIPQKLRFFRVRLRLAIGLKIDFDLDYAMVKNGPTRETYVLNARCNEAWFGFESMKKFCVSEGWTTAGKAFYHLFDDGELSNVVINDLLLLSNGRIKNEILDKFKRKTDVEQFINYLAQKTIDPANPNKNSHSRAAIQAAASKIQQEADLSTKDFLAIAYAIRNTYVHSGETAKSGTNTYANKARLLKIIFDFLILIQLKVIVHAIDRQYIQRGVPFP